MKKDKSLASYEEYIERLEQINSLIDKQELKLEEMLALYEESQQLIKNCEQILINAEQKIEIVTGN